MSDPMTATAEWTTERTAALFEADSASRRKRHMQILQLAAKFMDSDVLSLADRLYPFQYGSDERGHTTENQELRKLFVRLNNHYNDWETARTAFVTGNWDTDPLQVMKDYRKTLAKFNRAFVNIGFAEDFEDLYTELTNTTQSLFMLTELIKVCV